MDFARTMVKLFPETEMPGNVFFKYGLDRYRITWVRGSKVGYVSKKGERTELTSHANILFEQFPIRSVTTKGSRLAGTRRVLIDIGG